MTATNATYMTWATSTTTTTPIATTTTTSTRPISSTATTSSITSMTSTTSTTSSTLTSATIPPYADLSRPFTPRADDGDDEYYGEGPVSLETMEDPVIYCPNGHTADRKLVYAIFARAQQKGIQPICPCDGLPIDRAHVIPNLFAKSAIVREASLKIAEADPVMYCPNGHTADRKLVYAIFARAQQEGVQPICPCDGLPIDRAHVVPNLFARSAIVREASLKIAEAEREVQLAWKQGYFWNIRSWKNL